MLLPGSVIQKELFVLCVVGRVEPLGAGNSESQAGWRRNGKKTWVVNAGVKYQKSFLPSSSFSYAQRPGTYRAVCLLLLTHTETRRIYSAEAAVPGRSLGQVWG